MRPTLRALLLCWLCALAGPAVAAQVRHALVIGANQGGGVLEPLRYAERDAEQLGGLLVEIGEFDEELVTVLYAPSADQLRLALAEHAALAEQYDDDLFVFYYSGHADAQGLRLGDERYFFEALRHDFSAIDAGVRLGILDACRSGAISRFKGASVGASFLTQQVVAEGEAWLTASSADELAQESDDLRGGFFTHYLLSGLRGAADSGDGVVDLDELKTYTTDRVIARTSGTAGGTQTPHFDANLQSWGRLALTDLSRANARVIFPPDVGGQLSVIRLPDRVPVVEANKLSGDPMSLALPQGRYLVRRRSDGRLYEVGFSVNDGAVVELQHWGAARLEPSIARGADGRIDDYLGLSEAYERQRNLGASPWVAGAASTAIPGAGQLYNRQFAKGLAYFAVSASLMGTVFAPGELTSGPAGLGPMLGIAVWGASVADAAYQVHRWEKQRPLGGFTLTAGQSVGGGRWPTHLGLGADLMLVRGFSIGLDRVGWTPQRDGGWDFAVGSRTMMALHEGQRFRPGVFVALGYRHGEEPGSTVRLSRLVFGAGANLRYYVVPRYFVEAEGRWEQSGEWDGVSAAISLGTHIGR